MSALLASPSVAFPAYLTNGELPGSLTLHAEERRRRPRMKNDGLAMAVFSEGVEAGKLTPVRVTDTSVMGLGVLSPVAVNPGSAFSLMHESGCSPRQVGMVVRCEREGEFYRLGLKGRCLPASY